MQYTLSVVHATNKSTFLIQGNITGIQSFSGEIKAPRCICDMITDCLPQRATQSATSVMLAQPYSNSKTFGDRAFSIDAPRLWNKLPVAMSFSLDNFKRKVNIKGLAQAKISKKSVILFWLINMTI